MEVLSRYTLIFFNKKGFILLFIISISIVLLFIYFYCEVAYRKN